MNIYMYHPITREYTGYAPADKDPVKSANLGKFVPLVPANATLVEPPGQKDGYAIVFNNKWEYVKDNRKYKAIDTNLNIVSIDYLGDVKEGFCLATDKQAEIILEKPNFYLFKNGILVENPDYLKEEAEKEAARIAELSLTRADVERGIYQAKGLDFDDIITMVTELQPEGLDIKALKIELKANNFYRGNQYVDTVGALLGFNKKQLDLFFENGDYTYLLT